MISCFKDPTYVLMRVLLCKIQCPSFICFCKPSPHIYTAGPLKLENTPHVSSVTVVSANDDDDLDDAHEDVDCADGHGNEIREESRVDGKEEEGQGAESVLKSSLRKADSGSTLAEKRGKKKVQWVDLMGKDLAEIREFEPSEEEDVGYHGGKSCVCVIL
ncbi:PREDICTED: uncharacterized protein LOC104815671 [Tarenaya hassleriana]|uniref:uncharacterized protein LOC104815671 n=1 Tax=Tarenaya hassleriana TaxID=28532 RepID=UPI00053C408F|nr:PREDICTED: uncharacterized protein LOC104815671 [Tarenaya hassleriana]